jgi:hypothetical protein
MGFSWGRFPAQDFAHVEYRLFRRDQNGRTHVEIRRFFPEQTRAEIAGSVWRARIALRERVDRVFFAAEGIAA